MDKDSPFRYLKTPGIAWFNAVSNNLVTSEKCEECYVKDFAEAFVKLMHTETAKSEIVNIGSNDEQTVLHLAEIILEHMGIAQEIEKHDAPEGSVARRMPDISKIKKLTGWAPTTDLWTGLKHTVEANLK